MPPNPKATVRRTTSPYPSERCAFAWIRTSGLSLVNFRIKSFESRSGVVGGKVPINTGLTRVALLTPSSGFASHGCPRFETPIQALSRQHAELALGDIQPAAVFGGVHQLQLSRDAQSLRWLE